MPISFETTRFGSLEVEEDRIISFPSGLLGFPGIKRYVLMDYKDTPLKWLQAVDDPDVAFIVTEPRAILPDFGLELDPPTRSALKLQSDDDLAVLVVLRVEGEQVIANLNGPIVVNSRLMIGVQAVSNKN
ncbi:MAG: flagellar assembly protein FliW [Thermodesulfovibrionales bacterium]